MDCRELFTLLITFFGRGSEFQEDPFNYLDGAPKIHRPLDITDTDTDDETSAVEKEAVPSPQVSLSESQIITTAPTPVVSTPLQREPLVKSRPKTTYVDKVPDISMAQGFLPEDKDSLHNTGIPQTYMVRRSGTSSKGRSLYLCPFGDQCSSPPYSSDIASMGSHVHCHHLGHCIQCPYDGNRFYNGTGWRDHMSSKHEGAPWYRSQLGIDSQLPTALFKVTNPSSTVTAAEKPVAMMIPVPDPFVSNVPETDTLEFVPDIEEELPDDPVTEPEPPSTRQGIDIDSLTVANLKEITRFPPSDLRQYRYFGGGAWLGRHRRDDSKTRFFAAELASEHKGTRLHLPEEGEDRLLPKKRKHQMHLFVKGHGGKIWKAEDPKDDPNGGASMA